MDCDSNLRWYGYGPNHFNDGGAFVNRVYSLDELVRGNDILFSATGVTRSEAIIGPWVQPDYPLYHLLTQVNRLSSFRTQLERHETPDFFPALTKNTLKVISVILLVTALLLLLLCFLLFTLLERLPGRDKS